MRLGGDVTDDDAIKVFEDGRELAGSSLCVRGLCDFFRQVDRLLCWRGRHLAEVKIRRHRMPKFRRG